MGALEWIMIESNEKKCILCEKSLGVPTYLAQGSRRNSKVFLCDVCGLCQTIQGTDSNIGKKTLSSDADWGNVRHAKGLRLDAQKNNLMNFLKGLPEESTILDIGSSRGQFISWCNHEFPKFSFVGIEPDTTIAKKFEEENIQIILKRVEEVYFELKNQFDFIFCNHTLEHLDDFTKTLELMEKLLKPEGVLWIDVPNLKAIRDPFVIEEFFIDKHKTHFEIATLENALNEHNLEIKSDFSDNFNIVLVVSKSHKRVKRTLEHEVTKEDIARYKNTLVRNRGALPLVARKIESLPNVAIYGAGRILDALIRFGNMNVANTVIADRYLVQKASGLGLTIIDPDTVEWRNFEEVIVLARSSTSAIADWLKLQGVKKVRGFESLMSEYNLS